MIRSGIAESGGFRLEVPPPKIVTRRLDGLHQKHFKETGRRGSGSGGLRLASTRQRRFVGCLPGTTVEAAAERAGMGGRSTETEAGRGSGLVRHWRREVVTAYEND
ncbi:hypothetical protein SDJN03_26253, partial [Cucurbita argyrosperma subsp. sororia]